MVNGRTHVLFVASECMPLCKSGGLADVVGSLPSALTKCNVKVSIIIPFYGLLDDEIKNKAKTVAELTVLCGQQPVYCGLKYHKIRNRGYYFIDNQHYFNRDKLYGYHDECERFLFFSQAVLAVLPHIEGVDILHCHDWQTGAIPLLYHLYYEYLPGYQHLKTVFTIHNLRYQGRFSIDYAKTMLGMNERMPQWNDIEYFNDLNIMKAALFHSDYVTTVSPTYNEEIEYAYYGEGLDGVLKSIAHKRQGILNGLNVKEFNPESDRLIDYQYSDIEGKQKNKEAFRKKYTLPNDNCAMIGMITRLEDQKGLDLIASVMDEIMSLNIQFVLLGTGNPYYENFFRDIECKYPNRSRCFIMYDEALAHQIYAASDLFLMPSDFEPCGLGQMIAMRYGALPLVRETGGLKDSVKPYNKFTKEGTGFSFANYNAHEMLQIIKWATNIFHNEKEQWEIIVKNAMSEDFSWQVSAKAYREIYKQLL